MVIRNWERAHCGGIRAEREGEEATPRLQGKARMREKGTEVKWTEHDDVKPSLSPFCVAPSLRSVTLLPLGLVLSGSYCHVPPEVAAETTEREKGIWWMAEGINI
jgi:hypothetical protein